MLTTTHLGLKKPETTDSRSALRTAIGDNADTLDTALWRPYAVVDRVANQSIPTGSTPTAVSFDTETADTGSLFTISSPTLISIPITGVYQISADVILPNLTTIAILDQAGAVLKQRKLAAAATGGEDVLSTLLIFSPTVNPLVTAIKLGVAHSSGSSQNAQAELSIVRLAAP